ncbi:unnamed protein product [Mytilus coruscus]|uniref:PRRT1 n=1 Tax=Mytilus coruscus TaxID=42192 RepID=A0A6J8BPF9_MYTCO|nr:unnamed protein product [Mytilus coruscus]
MSEKNQDKYPPQSPPPPYSSTVPQGQPHGYEQPPPPQGYSHATGYQPVPQGYAQQGYPQTQHHGKQPMYGGQGQTVVVAQPVPSTMIVTTAQPRPSNCPNSAADSGNMQSAEQSARTARNLTILTVVLEKTELGVYPSAPEAYHQVGYPAPEEQHSDKYLAQSPPPPYASTVPQGQQYGQYPQGHSQLHGICTARLPQTQHYGKQLMYGDQEQTVVVAQPVPSTMIVTTAEPRPFNWLIPAILACLCCFWPTGICAIVAACNSNKAAD